MALLKPYAASRNWVIPGLFDTIQHIGSSYLWALYRMLINGAGIPAFDPWTDSGGYSIPAWTVDFSCNSTVAGTAHDAVDRIGSPYNASNLVWATEGSAHSWIVLKSPSGICSISKTRNGGGNIGPFYICINFAYTSGYQLDISISKLGYTGGSTTNRPTATDERVIGGAGAGNPPPFFQNHATTGSQRNMTLTFANDGTFWTALAQPGASPNHIEASFFALERDNDNRQIDLGALVFGLSISSSNANPPFVSQEFVLGSSYPNYGSAAMVGFPPSGTGSKLGLVVADAYAGGSIFGTASLLGGQSGSSDGQYTGREAWLFATDASSTYHDDLGRLVDVFLAPYVASTNVPGDGLFESAQNRMKVGNFWMPTSGAITL